MIIDCPRRFIVVTIAARTAISISMTLLIPTKPFRAELLTPMQTAEFDLRTANLKIGIGNFQPRLVAGPYYAWHQWPRV